MDYIKGGICIDRLSNGVLESLELFNQSSFKEWTGCYTKIIFKKRL